MQYFYQLLTGISKFSRKLFPGSLLVICVLLGQTLYATNYTPNTFTDHPIDGVIVTVNPATGALVGGPNAGAITLRSSLMAADMSVGPHTVTLGSGTYLLTQGSITFGN